MVADEIKIKFTATNNKRDSLAPQYSLNFKPINKSYDILSLLKEKYDLVIEFNSEMFMDSRTDNEKLISGLLEKIKAMKLPHTYSKITVPAKLSFLSQLFARNQTTEAHKIMTYVSDGDWSIEDFIKISKTYTARYYILEKPFEPTTDTQEILSKIAVMSESEKIAYCKLIVFAAPIFNQIGIKSDYLKESEIKSLLHIK